jgi:hypothetical protein
MKKSILAVVMCAALFSILAFTEKSKSLPSLEDNGKVYTEENKAIPPDFGNEEYTLLCVIKERKSYDKYLKKGVENNYKGKYEFITEKQLRQTRYKDTETYRYVFDYIDNYQVVEDGVPTGATFGKMFFVKDRVNDISYIREGQVNGAISNFGKAIVAYMIALETKRSSW